MCQDLMQGAKSPSKPKKDVTKMQADEVPMGDGLADSAARSILSRREKIRQAVEGVQPISQRDVNRNEFSDEYDEEYN